MVEKFSVMLVLVERNEKLSQNVVGIDSKLSIRLYA